MKYLTVKKIIFGLSILFSTSYAQAQDRWSGVDEDIKVAVSVDTLKKGKYTLVYIDKAQGFDPAVKQKLIDVFFVNYPLLAKKYNKKALKKVVFVMDPQYDGIAAAGNGTIRFNPEWFKKNPGDIDIVTHEGMHIVQAYPGDAGPGWITEGIADYVRFVNGVDNAGANWSLPALKPDQHYENAYRITARFFYWMEKNIKKGTMAKLDKAMRTKTYNADFWKEQTGKTVDELWDLYAANPVI